MPEAPRLLLFNNTHRPRHVSAVAPECPRSDPCHPCDPWCLLL